MTPCARACAARDGGDAEGFVRLVFTLAASLSPPVDEL
jgi:hypothetical protein